MNNDMDKCECGMDLAYCLDGCPKHRKPNLYSILHVISDRLSLHVGDLADKDTGDVDTSQCTFETDILVGTPEYTDAMRLFKKYREKKDARERGVLLRYLSKHWIEKGEEGFDSMLKKQCEYYVERMVCGANRKKGK